MASRGRTTKKTADHISDRRFEHYNYDVVLKDYGQTNAVTAVLPTVPHSGCMTGKPNVPVRSGSAIGPLPSLFTKPMRFNGKLAAVTVPSEARYFSITAMTQARARFTRRNGDWRGGEKTDDQRRVIGQQQPRGAGVKYAVRSSS